MAPPVIEVAADNDAVAINRKMAQIIHKNRELSVLKQVRLHMGSIESGDYIAPALEVLPHPPQAPPDCGTGFA